MLAGADGGSLLLSWEQIVEDLLETAVPSQRRLIVSPDGSVLAYVHGPTGALHLRHADGSEHVIPGVYHRDFRFAPDGRSIVALTGSRPPEGRARFDGPMGLGLTNPMILEPAPLPEKTNEVLLVDVATGSRRTLAYLLETFWVEWVRDGVVVEHLAMDATGAEAITYIPLTGPPRTLVSGISIDRLTATSAARDVVWFSGGTVYRTDLDDPSGGVREVATAVDGVRNAELSPRGERLAWVSWRAVYLQEGDGPPVELEAGHFYHSLWFSSDGGTLVYSSEKAAVWMGPDGRTLRYEGSSHPISSVRFRRDAPGLIVARHDALVVWDPVAATAERLALPDDDSVIEAGDVFSGGVVVLRSRDLGPPGERVPLPAHGPAPVS